MDDATILMVKLQLLETVLKHNIGIKTEDALAAVNTLYQGLTS